MPSSHLPIFGAMFLHLLALSSMAQEGSSEMRIPAACLAQEMPGGMMQTAQGDMAAAMKEPNRQLMQAIMAMHPPMMQAAMAENPDMAFTCSMIAHHLGAIAMARVELDHGLDDEARKRAQDVIDAQTKEVEEMTAWIQKHAAQ